jgi:hypothetical protein
MERHRGRISPESTRMQELALKHHKAWVECARRAREARKTEDRIVFEEFARRAQESAVFFERRAAVWRGE